LDAKAYPHPPSFSIRVRSARLVCATLASLVVLLQPAFGDDRAISCLGRLEPGDGVRRLASPEGGGVIDELHVREGDRVEQGQVLATLVSRPLRLAEVARLEAELEDAQSEERRLARLTRGNVTSAAKLDSAKINVRVARASLSASQAQLALSEIRSPIGGEVLEIHARPGELVGPGGVLELGATDRMMAVAEVYETDIAQVSAGQTAKISSPAFEAPLTGRVERIGRKVGRLDVIGTDPIAKTDARIVEVRIALDDADRARALTHLQVEIEIGP
jgi:HlyD family secretion protein